MGELGGITHRGAHAAASVWESHAAPLRRVAHVAWTSSIQPGVTCDRPMSCAAKTTLAWKSLGMRSFCAHL